MNYYDLTVVDRPSAADFRRRRQPEKNSASRRASRNLSTPPPPYFSRRAAALVKNRVPVNLYVTLCGLLTITKTCLIIITFSINSGLIYQWDLRERLNVTVELFSSALVETSSIRMTSNALHKLYPRPRYSTVGAVSGGELMRKLTVKKSVSICDNYHRHKSRNTTCLISSHSKSFKIVRCFLTFCNINAVTSFGSCTIETKGKCHKNC